MNTDTGTDADADAATDLAAALRRVQLLAARVRLGLRRALACAAGRSSAARTVAWWRGTLATCMKMKSLLAAGLTLATMSARRGAHA
jgi:hypothetical protein